MDDLESVIGSYPDFLDDILDKVVTAGFDTADFSQLDHVCYRTTSIENYEAKKAQLAAVGRLLTETLINDRPIATFRLTTPIRHGNWRIDAVELPSPKPGSDYQEGLEHIEFVLYDDIPTFLKKYQGMPFEMRAADRGINPEVGLKLGEYTVKFHLLSLTTVTYLEDKLGITSVSDNQGSIDYRDSAIDTNLR